jgi:hypothetical protein
MYSSQIQTLSGINYHPKHRATKIFITVHNFLSFAIVTGALIVSNKFLNDLVI